MARVLVAQTEIDTARHAICHAAATARRQVARRRRYYSPPRHRREYNKPS